jgi:acyl-CoA reductase-like NAD-dependent aldehyde dehydrogenase
MGKKSPTWRKPPRYDQIMQPVSRVLKLLVLFQEDVDKAVAAAKAAFSRNSEWRKMDASVRGKLINQLADLLQRDLKELARLETLDNGKPLSDSEFDIQCSVDVLRYYAGYCDKVHGHTIPSGACVFASVLTVTVLLQMVTSSP